jgi:hypothetical protein
MAPSLQFERDQKGANGPNETPSYAVRHFSVAEIAELWNLSQDFVRRLFEKEPGVLVIGAERPRGQKRRYSTLRIPEFVVERVHRRMSKA